MVDFFLVLALPGSGDELQGIKKGVLELADAIAVNKSDGEGAAAARVALADLRAALRYLPRRRPSWEVRALAVSGRTGEGLEALWAIVEEHRATLQASGELAAMRAEQQRAWMWSLIGEQLELRFRAHPEVQRLLAEKEADVVAGRIMAPAAVDELVAALRERAGTADAVSRRPHSHALASTTHPHRAARGRSCSPHTGPDTHCRCDCPRR